MKQLFGDFLYVCWYLIRGMIAFALTSTGGLAIVGSMFFEQTRSQITIEILLWHAAIFLIGFIMCSSGITLLYKAMK